MHPRARGYPPERGNTARRRRSWWNREWGCIVVGTPLNRSIGIGNGRHDSVSAASTAHSFGQLPRVEARNFALPSLATPIAPLLRGNIRGTSREDRPMEQPPVRSVDLGVKVRSRRGGAQADEEGPRDQPTPVPQYPP